MSDWIGMRPVEVCAGCSTAVSAPTDVDPPPPHAAMRTKVGTHAAAMKRFTTTPPSSPCLQPNPTSAGPTWPPKAAPEQPTPSGEITIGASVLYAASAPIVAWILVTPASAPKNVPAQPSTTAIRLSWSRPASTGGGKFLRYVVQDGSRVACTTTQSGCTVSDLSPGSAHTFKVYAVNTSGQGRGATVVTRTSVPVVAAPPPPVLTGPAPSKPVPTFS